METSSTIEFPAKFERFLLDNNIPKSAYELPQVYRYIRINPRNPTSYEELLNEFDTIESLEWLEHYGFFRLHADQNIANTEAYRNGNIYGLDASSGCVVVALDPQPGENILDFCCAPGGKLCMIADLMEHTGSLTGVDFSLERLSSCRNLCKKYNTGNIRLFLHDASYFSILAPVEGVERVNIPALKRVHGDSAQIVESIDYIPPTIPKTRIRKKKRKNNNYLDNLFHCNNWKHQSLATELYDKILVDVQCTLDASIRHVLKYKKIEWKGWEVNVDDDVVTLQKNILLNAYRLVKPGGIIVYSTCSFCTSQNEEVVEFLTQIEPTARVIPIETLEDTPSVEGTLKHTQRFYPNITKSSGMFIAKIQKVV
eukprot:TRINITY_DN12317_c0_g1_i1.p1 TRINITY_DN12317_c0_g1~~TRINITY_DN12317_c0_g1_i1.p1  ORF type:complete len:369 (-),score=68.22 TRINITY_DN12317_c0_g1_i1:148-1254(-)